MLSPGKFHLRVRRDPQENVEYRLWVLRQARRSQRTRDTLRWMCSQDILFWINTFVWQFNPRKKGLEVEPFCTWDFQDDALISDDPLCPGILWCVEHDQDLVIEKSREMGASWLLIIALDWMARFRRRQKFLCISRSEEAVESSDPDSLLWKLDHIHEHLPEWLRGQRDRKKRFIEYADTRSTITGQASTGKAGVGGRATAMLIDEMAQITEAYEVLHRTSDTTGCRLFNSTHVGSAGAFYDLTDPKSAIGAYIKKRVMHWSEHPKKRPGLYNYDPAKPGVPNVLDPTYPYPPDFNFVLDGTPTGGPYPGLRSPWYDDQCKRKGSRRAVAEDLDIDASGAAAQFFDAIVIRELQRTYACEPYWEGDVLVDRDMGRGELVPCKGGPLKLWTMPDYQGRVRASRYGAGADVSAGTGATPSVLSIADGPAGEKVAQYTNPHLSPENFAYVAVALCRLFHDATFCWEMQGPGIAFGRKVLELGYFNIYWRKNEEKAHDPGTFETPGWVPTPNNKRTMLEEYRADLSNRRFINRSHDALAECLKFKYTPKGGVEHMGEESKNDPTAARVNHGDHCIADGLCNKMVRDLDRKAPPPEDPPAHIGSLAGRRQYHEAIRRATPV